MKNSDFDTFTQMASYCLRKAVMEKDSDQGVDCPYIREQVSMAIHCLSTAIALIPDADNVSREDF